MSWSYEEGGKMKASSSFLRKKKEICKNVTKIILFVILNKNGFFCVRKLQQEVQKNRKTYAPRSSNPKRRCYTFKIPEGVEEIDVHSFDWNNYIVKNP